MIIDNQPYLVYNLSINIEGRHCMESKLSIAVIADIIASKKIENRAPLQEILNEILKTVNTNFNDQIESYLTITLGDEFQGIIKDFKTTFLIIDLIDTQLKTLTKSILKEEITLRWGIGVGKLVTPIKDKTISIGSDGPVYWNARNAIEKVHSQNDHGNTTEKLVSETLEDDFFNSIIRIQNVIKNQWTTTQQDTVSILLKEFGYEEVNNQKLKILLNQKLNKDYSEQTISKRVISTHIKQYVQSRIQLAERLEDWRKLK